MPLRKICTTMLASATSRTHDMLRDRDGHDPVGRREPTLLLAHDEPGR